MSHTGSGIRTLSNLDDVAFLGTNAVSLALTTGGSTLIAGPEHFSDFFAHSACVAELIADPVSGEVLAVITLTAPISCATG